jgi:hypothetical protein
MIACADSEPAQRADDVYLSPKKVLDRHLPSAKKEDAAVTLLDT